MSSRTQNQKEEKNKKRGFLISFFVHTIVLVLFLIPFMSNIAEENEDLDLVNLITINFAPSPDKTLNASMSMAAEAPPKPEETPELEQPQPETETEPTPKPQPIPKPVVLTPEPEPVVLPESTEHSENTETTPEVPQANAEPEVTETVSTAPAESSVEGAGTSGNSTTDGNAVEGDDIADFSGDGVFGRRVIYRPDIKKLSKKEGTIVVGVCVNQDGKVVAAQVLPEESSLSDKEILQMAEIYTKRYRFAKDYTAPSKQCGKLTYIIKI
ncbi:MAG: hypothetical protein AAF502_02080 [Bacteroidota bacterium]